MTADIQDEHPGLALALREAATPKPMPQRHLRLVYSAPKGTEG